jgi:hypothetical protein
MDNLQLQKMSNKVLFAHQIKAIERVIETDFETSVIQYATGTGKSLIGFEMIKQYHIKYPKHNILWICEHKNVIDQQFSGDYKFPSTLKVNNYSINKIKNWMDDVNSSCNVWKYTQLVVLNRAFLTSNENYKKLKIQIGLIVHDECHTSSNTTSQTFYKWIHETHPSVKCVGLSATPNMSFPFEKICIKYDMIDAIIDNVICTPIIYSFAQKNTSIQITQIFEILCELLNHEHAKHKIVIWCGTIKNCQNIVNAWKLYVQNNINSWENNVTVLEDHSRITEKGNPIQTFNSISKNAFLFCANKHREASDFRDLDGCVFMDGVTTREEKLFVQCLGRVLRKSPNKNVGWIFDAYAENMVECCERVLTYTHKNNKWRFNSNEIEIKGNKLNKIYVDICAEQNNYVNDAIECSPNTESKQHVVDLTDDDYDNGSVQNMTITANNIHKYFVRDYPDTPEYKARIHEEIKLMDTKNVFKYLEYAKTIQTISRDTIYITRGSCGSSLICYLLGITHVDPIKYNILFERFLHEKRDNLPDIDFDFPYNKRNDIFMRMYSKWGEEITRISSKINWKERSATREAIRQLGIHKQMNNAELEVCLRKLTKNQKMFVDKKVDELIDTQRTTMKHVGGVVFGYNNNITSNKLINITTDDKYDISESKTFKIDILSSRSLAIIQECCPSFTNANLINISDRPIIFDHIFGKGNNIGLVLAESVLMKRAFVRYKPQTIEELAWCFAIVRPMAKVARDSASQNQTDEYISDIPTIVYDDDVLEYISNVMNISICDADNIRRKIAKGDQQTIEKVIRCLVNKCQKDGIYEGKKLENYIEKHIDLIERLTEYGFCKSHSMSYAMMIWHLARLKYDYPQLFWKACLDHADSSYVKWVHLSEAVFAGVDIKHYVEKNRTTPSVYSQTRYNNQMDNMKKLSEREQLLQYGYWLGLIEGKYYDGCYFTNIPNTNKYRFRGILAAIRTPQTYKKMKQSGLYLGIGFQTYLDIIVPGMTHFDNKRYVGLEGVCVLHNAEERIYRSISYYLI